MHLQWSGVYQFVIKEKRIIFNFVNYIYNIYTCIAAYKFFEGYKFFYT